MIAIREYAKVKDHQLHINLPKDFNFEEVEVIVMPRPPKISDADNASLAEIGKIGFHSRSFVTDDEDYSQW
jgi:hypothetical protein